MVDVSSGESIQTNRADISKVNTYTSEAGRQAALGGERWGHFYECDKCEKLHAGKKKRERREFISTRDIIFLCINLRYPSQNRVFRRRSSRSLSAKREKQ